MNTDKQYLVKIYDPQVDDYGYISQFERTNGSIVFDFDYDHERGVKFSETEATKVVDALCWNQPQFWEGYDPREEIFKVAID